MVIDRTTLRPLLYHYALLCDVGMISENRKRVIGNYTNIMSLCGIYVKLLHKQVVICSVQFSCLFCLVGLLLLTIAPVHQTGIILYYSSLWQVIVLRNVELYPVN